MSENIEVGPGQPGLDGRDCPTSSGSPVQLDRDDVLALLLGYQRAHNVTMFYRGDPLIERVRAALATSDDTC